MLLELAIYLILSHLRRADRQLIAFGFQNKLSFPLLYYMVRQVIIELWHLGCYALVAPRLAK